jgi:hypothetical protein
VVDRQPAVHLLGEDPAVTVRRAAPLLAALALVAGLSAGCDGDDPRTAPSSTAAPTTPAPAPAPPPPRGACYDLDLAEASEPTNDSPPVRCGSRHAAVTVHVGTFDPVVDGHLLALDSDKVQQQVARRCRGRFERVVGGSEETQRLSRLTVVWFTPTLEQGDLGARWFRCDAVALAGRERLARLPRSVRGALAADDALDRFGTCGTASPAADRFERVICAQRHSWRARATIELPRGAAYLGKRAGAEADAACRDIEARLASDILRLRWSFEWPTREQWDGGQRYGYCWTPDPA